MKKKIAIIICLIVLTGCASGNLERRATLSFDYSMVRTFSFDDRNSGVVGLAVPERDELIVYIRKEIERGLIAQGYIPVKVHGDTRIRFGLILKSNGKNIMPKKAPPVPKEKFPEYAATFDYKPGSLIVDSVDPFYNRIAWRSAIDTGIKPETPLSAKKERVVPMIKTLLKNFPNI